MEKEVLMQIECQWSLLRDVYLSARVRERLLKSDEIKDEKDLCRFLAHDADWYTNIENGKETKIFVMREEIEKRRFDEAKMSVKVKKNEEKFVLEMSVDDIVKEAEFAGQTISKKQAEEFIGWLNNQCDLQGFYEMMQNYITGFFDRKK